MLSSSFPKLRTTKKFVKTQHFHNFNLTFRFGEKSASKVLEYLCIEKQTFNSRKALAGQGQMITYYGHLGLDIGCICQLFLQRCNLSMSFIAILDGPFIEPSQIQQCILQCFFLDWNHFLLIIDDSLNLIIIFIIIFIGSGTLPILG